MANISLLLLSLLCCSSTIFGDNTVTRYDGYTVYRLIPKTRTQLEYLHDLSLTTTEVDFWTYPSAINASVDVMLSPEQKDTFGLKFRNLDIERSILINDVEKLAEQQRNEVVQNYTTPFTREAVPRFFTAYRRLADILSFLQSIVDQYPSISALETIGTSTENRPLRLIKLGVNVGSNTKPIYFIDSLIHAREWITGASTTYFIQYLVDQYAANNAAVVQLLTTYNVYVLPVLNPDGYEFTHTNTRLWRKTRAPNSGSTCVGTDPNRNWANNWNVAGASTNPCSEIYSGTAANSQPEVKAISDYLLSLGSRIKIYIDVHSYSQLLLYSYGYSTALPPDNAQLLARGTAATNALTAVNNIRYTIGTITNVLYAASGSAVDFGYENAGIKYSYTIELRDTGTNGFQLPVNQIVPSGNENNAFFLKLGQDVATEL